MDGSMTRADIPREQRSDASEPLDRLMPIVYGELRAIAHRQLAMGGRGGTLATTALVHEAYIKLVDQSQAQWRDRTHFFAVAALAMRHVLVDQAKARRRLKRGGDQRHVSLDEENIGADDQPDALLELNEALTRLAAFDPRLARVVEYRFFGGLTEQEIAEAMGVTLRTVQRAWAKARALLHRALVP
jgi:RNA polymerase sigma factor (TIGR02999 family)